MKTQHLGLSTSCGSNEGSDSGPFATQYFWERTARQTLIEN
jgi:hypothetical protein